MKTLTDEDQGYVTVDDDESEEEENLTLDPNVEQTRKFPYKQVFTGLEKIFEEVEKDFTKGLKLGENMTQKPEQEIKFKVYQSEETQDE